MTEYITQVVLRDAGSEDYLGLDEAMLAANFFRQIRSPKGCLYDLPSGTYFSQAEGMSSATVRDRALTIARRFCRGYDIVTVAGDIAYFLHPSPLPPS